MPSRERPRRIEDQLEELVNVERPRLLASMGTVEGNDPADQADRVAWEVDLAHLDQRIRRLRDRLARRDAGASGGRPSGPAPGSRLVLDFGNGPETFLFSDLDGGGEVDVVTPDSPLGRALAHASVGESVRYVTPRGEVAVNVLAVALPAAV